MKHLILFNNGFIKSISFLLLFSANFIFSQMGNEYILDENILIIDIDTPAVDIPDIPTPIDINSLKFEDGESFEFNNGQFIPEPLKFLESRIFLTESGIEAFRENLGELLGKIVYSKEGQIEIGYRNFKKDSTKTKQFVPKNGKLKFHKYTHKDSQSIGLFISASRSNEYIYEYSIIDIFRAVLLNNQIDEDELKSWLERSNNIEGAKLINAVTVTEVLKKKYNKNEKRLKASKLPGIASAFSYDGHFFISTEDFEREYKIGVSTISLKIIAQELSIE